MLRKLEDELDLEEATELEPLFPRGEAMVQPYDEKTWGQTFACPRPTRVTVSGFSRYSMSVASLPPSEQIKVRKVASLIIRSFRPRCQPIVAVRLVGHADYDLPRERREPGFMMGISRARAFAVKQALERLINNRVIASRITWDVRGVGASQLVVRNPTTEAGPRHNRRVEIRLSGEMGVLEFEGPVPKTSTKVVAVGQRVELDLSTMAFAGDIDDIRWTVPGTVVRGYDGNANNGKLFKLTDADCKQPKISFFWVDAADGRIVRARYRLKSGRVGQVVFDFDVKGPTMSDFTGKTDVTRTYQLHGSTVMSLGRMWNIPGIEWKWTIIMPPTHAGYIKDVQTVLNDRSKILFLKPGGRETRKLVWRHPLKTAPHVQLDGNEDGQAAYTAGLSKEKRNAGTSFTEHGTPDYPNTTLLPLYKAVSVNDQFTYYIMFKPATDKAYDAIWVPVAKAKWFWKVTATRQDKEWRLEQPKPKMEPSITMATVNFPIYETNALENEWLEPLPPKPPPKN